MARSALALPISRASARVLIAAQVLLGLPVARTPTMYGPSVARLEAAPAPPQVQLNRTVPKVSPPSSEPVFSASPTAEEIFRARVFAEPLVPVGAEPTAAENRALADALLTFHRSGGTAWRDTIGVFLIRHPGTAWTASLQANLGTLRLREHAFSRALESWDEAYALARSETSRPARAVADMALAEWLSLASTFGPSDRLTERLAEAARRGIAGAAGVKIARVRENLATIRNYPDRTVACAAEALSALLRARGMASPGFLDAYVAKSDGTSLLELNDLAARAGLAMRMVQRDNARSLPTPSIVHLKVQHYVAVISKQGDRYEVADRGRGVHYWIDENTLFDEMSDFALIADDAEATGWVDATSSAAATVKGSGPLCPDGSPPQDPPCPECCPTGGPGGGGGCGGGAGCGMPIYTFQRVTASVLLHDTPVGYTPSRGPGLPLTATYAQRTSHQPQTFTASNLGPKWSLNWMLSVQEVPTDGLGVTPPHVAVTQAGGGREVFINPNAEGVFPAHWSSRAILVRVSSNPVRYERRRPDGTIEVFGVSDGAPVGQRQVFLTELIDPVGQQVQLTWDAQRRLVAITDATGLVTVLGYDDPDPLKVTKIADPFGRFATFAYNPQGQLASITDVGGLTSSFTYGLNDFVTAMTTPYGTTTFRHENVTGINFDHRFIEATDPLGGTERVEFRYETPTLPASVAASEVPVGFAPWNAYLNRYNTFYWSKRAWMLGKNDLSKAEITHWLVAPEFGGWQKYSYVAHSVQTPLEGRVWYAYPGQVAGNEDELGWFAQPSRVGRVLDDGTSQISETTYKLQGSPLTKTDPAGRQTTYSYAADGVTLTEVRQTGNGANDVLATYGNFTSLNLPQTVTDAAGQSTTLTYNAAGQVVTVTNARNETATYAYGTDGRLASVTGAVAGATTTYTYDGYGRPRTVTDSDGYTLTTDYDLFDRVTRVTYPDQTYEAVTYDRLDVATRRDRDGRVTRSYYDALRRLTATRDPLGRVVTQVWCPCGGLDALIDANGNRTSWERDLQGRVTREIRADGVTDTLYTYGPRSGRLLTVTDPKDQVTNYAYTVDGQIAATTFSNAMIATHGVSYTYESAYPRAATMEDGTGVTTYTYKAAGQLGAGSVASVDGPLVNDTITYDYDVLGRVVGRAINGVGLTYTIDALGRVTAEANALGTFTYGYEAVSARLASVTYPNGQTSSYSYHPNGGDRRLQTIHHKYPNGTTLSKFDYTYSASGDILTWRQQADATAVQWEYVYDLAGQLLGAEKWSTGGTPAILSRYAYAYDPGGNRTSEQIDDQVTGASYDALNRLVSQQPSGPLVFVGTTNEPATVTVQGKPTVSTAGNGFRAPATVTSGTSTVTVTATDPSGNVATQAYEVDSVGTGRTFTYDANGNLTADGTRTFEWDARNQLVALNVGTHRSEFTYDGLQRRVREIQKESGVTQSDLRMLWCGKEECEERTVDGTTVTRRIWWQGEYAAGAARFFAADHVGSVTDVTDGAATALARYTFDVGGRRTIVSGTDLTDVGYTGHRWQATGHVWLALYRGYDPDLGRWLSEDPVGFGDGPNVFAYAGNDPVGAYDPLGLTAYRCRRPLGGRGGISKRQERTGTYHEYYCVSNDGVTRCCGQTTDSPTGYGSGRPTRPDEGDVVDPEQCTTFPATDCVERCLLRNCDAPRPWYGVVGPGTNCQEWTADSRNACRDRCEAEDRRGGR